MYEILGKEDDDQAIFCDNFVHAFLGKMKIFPQYKTALNFSYFILWRIVKHPKKEPKIIQFLCNEETLIVDIMSKKIE